MREHEFDVVELVFRIGPGDVEHRRTAREAVPGDLFLRAGIKGHDRSAGIVGYTKVR